MGRQVCVWLGDGFKPDGKLTRGQTRAVIAAYDKYCSSGHPADRFFKLDGSEHEFDFEQMVQINTVTGKRRLLSIDDPELVAEARRPSPARQNPPSPLPLAHTRSVAFTSPTILLAQVSESFAAHANTRREDDDLFAPLPAGDDDDDEDFQLPSAAAQVPRPLPPPPTCRPLLPPPSPSRLSSPCCRVYSAHSFLAQAAAGGSGLPAVKPKDRKQNSCRVCGEPGHAGKGVHEKCVSSTLAQRFPPLSPPITLEVDLHQVFHHPATHAAHRHIARIHVRTHCPSPDSL